MAQLFAGVPDDEEDEDQSSDEEYTRAHEAGQTRYAGESEEDPPAVCALDSESTSEYNSSLGDLLANTGTGQRGINTSLDMSQQLRPGTHAHRRPGTRAPTSTPTALLLAAGALLCIVFLYCICRYDASPPPAPGTANCTLHMYGNDTHAYWACRGLDALQNNWFPSPIGGLFTYQAWNGYDGFWQNGVVLETLANFQLATRSRRYARVLRASLRSLADLTHAYAPQPSCDDELWFGLAYARLYASLRDEHFLALAGQVLEWVWAACWDKSGRCGGGLWFDSSRTYKATITNAQALQLAARLYAATGEKRYRDRALLLLRYLQDNRVITADFLVADAIDAGTCAPNNVTGYTYDSGEVLGGLAELYLATGDRSHLELAHSMARASITALSQGGVLTELCDAQACRDNRDAKSFKGIFVRNLRYLVEAAGAHSPQAAEYLAFLRYNSAALLAYASCDAPRDVGARCALVFQDGPPLYTPLGPVFSERWAGPFNGSSPIEHSSALELLIASVEPGVECQGADCDFDPAVPAMGHLGCTPDPCPAGFSCCTDEDRYHTCCTPGQVCRDGGCY